MVVGMTSCDSMIYDEQGDCSVHYKVSFRYTKNILNADAFGSQVTEVNLALYDQDGRMVLHKTEEREVSEENTYSMEVDVLPGRYDMIAWCEGQSNIPDAVSFTFSGQEQSASLTESAASLPLKSGDNELYSNSDINRLYYGFKQNVEFIDSYGTVNIDPIYLTKDTNHFTIILQDIDGNEIDPDNISFELRAENNHLDWQNKVTDGMSFIYQPWSITSFSFDSEEESDTRAVSNVANGVKTEMTTGRLIAGREQRLTVMRKDTGEKIFSIPLIEYLMLVRSEYEQVTSNQDYLDRFDDFSLVFFMQEGYTWVKTRVLINGFRRVPPQHEDL